MEWARVEGPLKRANRGFAQSRSSRHVLGLCGLALAVALAGACRSAQSTQPPPAGPGGQAPTEPTWIGEPLSWEKLDAIERWLVESADAHDPSLEIEARLELSEGRLEFARRDLRQGGTYHESGLVRLELARRGFEGLLADERTSAGQRLRAQAGLDAARALVERPVGASLAILPRSSWNARPARTREMTRVGGSWSRITVHHSAKSDDEGSGSSQDTAAVLRRIQKVHMDRGDPNHGWADIGYHFLIDGKGRILEGRELAWQGAHARGVNNRGNIGVCLLGDFSRRAPTPEAMRSLERLLDDLCMRFRISAVGVYTHKELTATDCPGASLSAWVERYRRVSRPGS